MRPVEIPGARTFSNTYTRVARSRTNGDGLRVSRLLFGFNNDDAPTVVNPETNHLTISRSSRKPAAAVHDLSGSRRTIDPFTFPTKSPKLFI